MILTAFWIFLTAPGLAFAVMSLAKGRRFLRHLEQERPELVATYRVELARDLLLAILIGIMVMIGFAGVAAVTYGALKPFAGAFITIGFFAMAILVDILAIANYWLRSGATR